MTQQSQKENKALLASVRKYVLCESQSDETITLLDQGDGSVTNSKRIHRNPRAGLEVEVGCDIIPISSASCPGLLFFQ